MSSRVTRTSLVPEARPPSGLQGRGDPAGVPRWRGAHVPLAVGEGVDRTLARRGVVLRSVSGGGGFLLLPWLLESWLGSNDWGASGRDWSRRPNFTLPEVGCLGPWFPPRPVALSFRLVLREVFGPIGRHLATWGWREVFLSLWVRG